MTPSTRNKLFALAIIAALCAAGLASFLIDSTPLIRLNQRLAPDIIESFCQSIIGLLTAGDYDAVLKLTPETSRKDPSNLARLKQLPKLNGTSEERSLLFYRAGKSSETDGTIHVLIYQLRISGSYYVIQFSVMSAQDTLKLTGLRLNAAKDSLRNINAFTRAPVSWVRPLMLGLPGFFLVLTFAAFYLIFQVPRKDKWIWLILVFAGIGGLQVNWTTLEFRYLFLINLPFVRWTRDGAYLPWIFSYTFPIGLFASGVYLWLTRPRKKRPD
jgi:hypothetical protein